MSFDFIATALHASGEQLAHENNEFLRMKITRYMVVQSAFGVWSCHNLYPLPTSQALSLAVWKCTM